MFCEEEKVYGISKAVKKNLRFPAKFLCCFLDLRF